MQMALILSSVPVSTGFGSSKYSWGLLLGLRVGLGLLSLSFLCCDTFCYLFCRPTWPFATFCEWVEGGSFLRRHSTRRSSFVKLARVTVLPLQIRNMRKRHKPLLPGSHFWKYEEAGKWETHQLLFFLMATAWTPWRPSAIFFPLPDLFYLQNSEDLENNCYESFGGGFGKVFFSLVPWGFPDSLSDGDAHNCCCSSGPWGGFHIKKCPNKATDWSVWYFHNSLDSKNERGENRLLHHWIKNLDSILACKRVFKSFVLLWLVWGSWSPLG